MLGIACYSIHIEASFQVGFGNNSLWCPLQLHYIGIVIFFHPITFLLDQIHFTDFQKICYNIPLKEVISWISLEWY